MEVLSSNQSNLIVTLLIFSITYYLRCYFLSAAAAYLNMTVSNKKALATLETVHK